MKDVLDAVAAHKTDIHTMADQLQTASPSGIESIIAKIRAAVIMLENEVAAIFESRTPKPAAPPLTPPPAFVGADGGVSAVDPGPGANMTQAAQSESEADKPKAQPLA